jgi:phosphopantothenate---cysteine ligase (CTP)
MKPLVCVTCGPAYEPLDDVRRLTNFSTGEIGAVLVRELLGAGAETICFRGEGATASAPDGDVRGFTTNASLSDALQKLHPSPDLIFHAAALSDFTIGEIDRGGLAKLDSRKGEIQVTLVPAPKVLPLMKRWFPNASVVGWKYELDGTRRDALARAARQIETSGTQACVVNGRAYGEGFGLLFPDGRLAEYPDKPSLAAGLAATFVRPLSGRLT